MSYAACLRHPAIFRLVLSSPSCSFLMPATSLRCLGSGSVGFEDVICQHLQVVGRDVPVHAQCRAVMQIELHSLAFGLAFSTFTHPRFSTLLSPCAVDTLPLVSSALFHVCNVVVILSHARRVVFMMVHVDTVRLLVGRRISASARLLTADMFIANASSECSGQLPHGCTQMMHELLVAERDTKATTLQQDVALQVPLDLLSA